MTSLLPAHRPALYLAPMQDVTDLPFLKVKVESSEGNNQSFLLRVTFNEKPTVGTHTGKIKVETNNKDVPLVEIPVIVVAK